MELNIAVLGLICVFHAKSSDIEVSKDKKTLSFSINTMDENKALVKNKTPRRTGLYAMMDKVQLFLKVIIIYCILFFPFNVIHLFQNNKIKKIHIFTIQK